MTESFPCKNVFYAGAMSGTSLDGVDCVIARFTDKPETVARSHIDFSSCLKKTLLELTAPGDNEIKRAALAANEVSETYAQCFLSALDASGLSAADIRAYGVHGQTVRHAPRQGFSIQLINGALVALKSGVPVVTDFRSADIALGGEGAPLVPVFQNEIFSLYPGCAVLNIGGIANIAFFGEQPYGYDCGPGNALLDVWTQMRFGKSYDAGGKIAGTGKTSRLLFNRMFSDPYFSMRPPKSTGREYFSRAWLEEKLQEFPDLPSKDVLKTLTELTAAGITQAVQNAPYPCRTLFVCGGGVFNSTLMRMIKRDLPGTRVESTAFAGLDPMDMEALAFAYFAKKRILGEPLRLSSVTGAGRDCVSGALYLP